MKNTKPKRKKSSLILWGLLLLIILGIVAMIGRIKGKPVPEKQKEEEQIIPVSVILVEETSTPNLLELPGKLEAFLDLTLSIERPGIVKQLLVEKGSIVTNGQLLLKTDDRLALDAVQQAKINLRETEKDYTRWSNLHTSGAISKASFDDYKTQHELAQIRQIDAQINLEKVSIISPVNGFINDSFVEQDEYLNEGQRVFQILVLNQMKLIIHVPEQNIPFVSLGDTIPFTVKALPDTTFNASVSFIAGQALPGSNAFLVEALVDNPDLQLKAGMMANIQLNLGQTDTSITVPLSCIIPDKGVHVVFISDGERAERRQIIIENIRGNKAILKKGLIPGEKLITTGHRSLSDGMKIEEVKQQR